MFNSDFDPLDDALDFIIFEDVTKEKRDKKEEDLFDFDDEDDDE